MTGALDRAQALLDVERHQEARRLLTEHLATEPTDAHALRLLARCEEAADEPDRMLAAATAACAAEPDDEWGHRLRALALARLDRPVDAVAAATEAVRLAPDTWQCRVTLAAAYESDPRYGRRALAAARDAVTLAPDEPATHFLYGLLLHARDRHGAARRAYLRTLRHDPGHAGALQNLGRLAERASRLGTSLRYFGAAASTAPAEVAGTGHLRRVLRQLLGIQCGAALFVPFVLVWAMFPVAWAVAAVLVAAPGLWVWRTLRVLPGPSRAQALSWLRTDPRCLTLVWSVAVLLTVGVVIGVVAATTVDVDGPAGTRVAVLGGVAIAAALCAALTVKVVERLVGRSADEVRAAATDPRGRVSGWQLFTRFRQLWVAAVLALLLAPGADAQPDWALRAVLGAAAVAGYVWFHLRSARRPPHPLARGWDRFAGWYPWVNLSLVVCLACVVALGALPDAHRTALGFAALPPLLLVPLMTVVQVGRLAARLARGLRRR